MISPWVGPAMFQSNEPCYIVHHRPRFTLETNKLVVIFNLEILISKVLIELDLEHHQTCQNRRGRPVSCLVKRSHPTFRRVSETPINITDFC